MCPEPDDVIDSDVDLRDPAQATQTRSAELALLAAVATGGVLGAEARYGLGLLVPHHAAQFPWATLLINLSGCLALGALMVVLLERAVPAHRLARPFLGVGILGGYTTFSTFAVDLARLIHDGRAGIAVVYLLATLLGCQVTVLAGTAAARALLRNSADLDRP